MEIPDKASTPAAPALNGPDVAARQIRERIGQTPRLAIVLGSGFSPVLKLAHIVHRLSYSEIPGFPVATVAGHTGELLVAQLGACPVLVLSGRVHYYEGHDMGRVTLAVRTMAALGVRRILLTNAAGGIHPEFERGDFMVLDDHINFMGDNPLRGPVEPGRERFMDMTRAYDAGLSDALFQAGIDAGLRMRRGTYLAVSGPSYETPAEIRAFGRWGADAVGMSTVPETIAARHCRMRVAAVSCITNLAAGISKGPLSHEEVMETASLVGPRAAGMLLNFVNSNAIE